MFLDGFVNNMSLSGEFVRVCKFIAAYSKTKLVFINTIFTPLVQLAVKIQNVGRVTSSFERMAAEGQIIQRLMVT